MLFTDADERPAAANGRGTVRRVTVRPLGDLKDGETANFFALLAEKEQRTTKAGKPFFKLTVRDPARTAAVMIWGDGAHFVDCRENWKRGEFYKLRGKYVEHETYGAQVELDKIRPVTDADADDGFDPQAFFDASRFDPDRMFQALLSLVDEHVGDVALRGLVRTLLEANEPELKRWPAATRYHHAYIGGFLEHVLSVTRTAAHLAQKYAEMYPRMNPALSTDLVVAGAVLHDIGKLRELDGDPAGARYTPAGNLLGHILLGRDMVREAAAGFPGLAPETLLRLEHAVVSHHGTREFGSPTEPQTPEALLVHHADEIDAKFRMVAATLEGDAESPADGGDPFTGRDNPLRRGFFRGLPGS